MKILLLSVGKKHEPALADAISDFTSRISHYCPVEWKLISPSNAEEEGKSILETLGDRDFAVLLDEKGKELGSVEFAKFIETRLNESTHRSVFIIGGAFGVSASVREKADAVISLSKLTFPHMLVRLILSEQIYRAFSILKGEKYHHG